MRQPLGQHFLRSEGILENICRAADLKSTDTVLEIGPGKGALTEKLIYLTHQVTAVELDRTLAPALKKTFADYTNIQIIEADFLKVDLTSLFPSTISEVKVLGNLPYSITSAIFQKIMPWALWKTGVFLIQKEVADRMMAAHGSKTYGVLSLATQLFATVEKVRLVPPGAFSPPPKVMSMVIRITRRPEPLLAESLHESFFDFVHGAFAHRRKTLANSLAFHTGQPAAAVHAWLEKQKINPQQRAETLALEQFVNLAHPWSIYRREFC